MVTAIFNPDSTTSNVYGLWQYDYGQTLRIQGLHLPSAVEIHFSLQETGGTSVMRVGVTKDGVTDVIIPDSMLENDGATRNYEMFAFVYLTDVTSGQTEYKIKLQVKSRPKPEVPGGGENPDIFHEAVKKVKESADKAAESEKQAEGWAHGWKDLPERAQDNAKYYSDQAAADAKKTGADRKEVERLVESVSGIDEQVAKVENLTKQAQTSATNAALSEQAAKTAETNAQTAQAGAETAEGNAELAEQGAKASEQAVEKAKQLVTQMGQEVLNNKNHVDQTAHEFTLTAQQAVADVNNAGQTQTERVQAAGNTAVESVKTAQNTATKAVETAKADAVQVVRAEGITQTGNVTAEGQKQLTAVQQAAQEIVADREQIQMNKADIALLKDIAVVEKVSGKTIIIEDASDFPVKSLQGTGKITITGKNILNGQYNVFVPFSAKAGTVFTLLTNGQPSEGGNIKFIGEDNSEVWFAIDKGETKVRNFVAKDVKGFYDLLVNKDGLSYCFSVGDNDTYEEYKEQVVTMPIPEEQLKSVHTNYPITVLTSENEITVEYVADTEKYIGKRIKEENQTLQNQILEIQSALISQKISGGGIKVTDSARMPIKGFKVFGKSIQDGVPTPDNPVPIVNVGDNIKCCVSGKNICSSHQVDIVWSKYAASLYVDAELKPNTVYTFSYNSNSIGNSFYINENLTKEFHAFDENGERIAQTFTTKDILDKKDIRQYSPGRGWIFLKNFKDNAPSEFAEVQIEENSIATSYIPYTPIQSLTLQTPTGLPGLKVNKGGSYTDSNGQRWVCDEIDLERGKYVQRVARYFPAESIITQITDGGITSGKTIMVRHRSESKSKKNFRCLSNFLSKEERNIWIKDIECYNHASDGYVDFRINKDRLSTVDEAGIKDFCRKIDAEIYYILETPIETDLPPEEIAAYKALHANYPTTVITNDAGAGMELTYITDTKNYVDTKIAEISTAIVKGI